ncbi:MAG TPA: tetratricopeptide repeat protein, partial [Longimicrobiales bacterium]
RSALEDRAANELTQVRQIAASGNLPLASRQLKQFVSKYSGTRAGAEGRLLLGQMLLQQNQAKEAAPVVQPLASDLGDPLGPPAAFLLGAAYEGMNNVAQAEATYLRIADGARFEFQKRDALEDAARLKLQNNDPAGAVSLYERILKAVPDTAVGRPVYEMRLAEAQAAAQAKK